MTGAVVLWASFPPCDLWPLAWVAPVAWIPLIRRRELPGHRPYRALWVVGFVFWMATSYWLVLLHWATSFAWVALSLYLALYLPLFVGLSRVAVHRLGISAIVAAPVVWTGLELARGHLFTGFTLASLGHTQYRWIELIQLSDLAGAYGVSFVVMWGAACLGRMLPCDGRRQAFWPILPAAVVIVAALAYGHVRTSGPRLDSRSVRVALIQGSIDVEVKSDPKMQQVIQKHYTDLSLEAVSPEAVARHGKPDLLVWPETMFRIPLITYAEEPLVPDDWPDAENQFAPKVREAADGNRRSIAGLARQLKVPLVLGVDRLHYGSDGFSHFNSAIFVDGDGRILDCYDKMHLVIFGEYVPFADWFPWLEDLTPLGVSASAGEEAIAFALDDRRRPTTDDRTAAVRFSPDICYETVLPHVIRRQINMLRDAGREPDVLLNLTNDGWYRGSTALDMHLICGVFRAVECRKPLLIAANTGFSAWIDGDGRLRTQGPRRDTAVLVANAQIDSRHSWYLKYGDWAAGTCLAACGVLALCGWRNRRRRANG